MTATSPFLHLLCGKIASGKSTLSAHLAKQNHAVLIAEDTWLNALYEGQIATVADYMRCAAALRGIMGPHVVALLKAGTSVVLDFQANTVASRAWMRGIAEESGVRSTLHWLDTPDVICLKRLRTRNAQGAHPFAATEEQFHRVSSHFVAPTPEEGFTIKRHVPDPEG